VLKFFASLLVNKITNNVKRLMKLDNTKELIKTLRISSSKKQVKFSLCFIFITIVQYLQYELDEWGFVVAEICLLSTPFELLRSPIQFSLQWVPGNSFPGGKAAEVWSLPLTFT
jgi:hypothetical protein